MAELADALDLGSSGATRTGSIPASRTTKNKIVPGIGPKEHYALESKKGTFCCSSITSEYKIILIVS